VDIFRVLPFGGSILKVELKGSLLIKVLNYGEEKRGKGAYLQRFNVEFDSQSQDWKISDHYIDDNKIYKVVLSDYLLKGYDIPFLNRDNKEVGKIYKPKKEEVTSDIRKTIISYLRGFK
jgi:2',3'-cyclic-nucleotide 2'-phosphodiesterase (5'-nucleotidase family)